MWNWHIVVLVAKTFFVTPHINKSSSSSDSVAVCWGVHDLKVKHVNVEAWVLHNVIYGALATYDKFWRWVTPFQFLLSFWAFNTHLLSNITAPTVVINFSFERPYNRVTVRRCRFALRHDWRILDHALGNEASHISEICDLSGGLALLAVNNLDHPATRLEGNINWEGESLNSIHIL